MYKIYKIEDINDLVYIGKTKNALSKRFSNHVCEQRNYYGKCSSSKLNLYNSIITIIEDNLTEEEATERETYYINSITCVNTRTNHCDIKKYKSKYRSVPKNKETERQGNLKWYAKNKETILSQKRIYNKTLWYCEVCKCSSNLNHKSRHLKTKKHLLNI